MQSTTLSTMLQGYFPAAPEEKTFKQTIIRFIEENSNCFERSLEIGHITASCWLVNKDNSAALLTHHAKLNKWFQLGGHCDGNPDVLMVAIKEAQEESGIITIAPLFKDIFDIDIHLIPANKNEAAHYHYDIRFLLQVTSDEQISISHESKELRWITKDRAALPADDPSLIRMFNKWIDL